jgi:hypothetical protein
LQPSGYLSNLKELDQIDREVFGARNAAMAPALVVRLVEKAPGVEIEPTVAAPR